MMGNCVGEYGSSSMGGCGGGDGVGGGGSSGRGGHMFVWFCVAERGSVVVVGFAGVFWDRHTADRLWPPWVASQAGGLPPHSYHTIFLVRIPPYGVVPLSSPEGEVVGV